MTRHAGSTSRSTESSPGIDSVASTEGGPRPMRVRSRIRIRSRVRKLVFWGALLILATLAGGLCMAYLYVTDGTTLAALIESKVPRSLPGSRLVLGRVKVLPYKGELQLVHVALK